MTELSPSLEPPLLADLGWVRSLAQSLARDATLADDVAQDAFLLALRHRPAPGTRAWCVAVVRSLVRQHARRERRRRERECRAARPEATAAAGDLVARAHAQRDLVEKVLRLDEPYRTAILLRFFEGLPPREIARRTGVPAATVHSRLTRALRLLRASLDAQHGDRAWLAAFLPLGVPDALPNYLGPFAVGETLMNAKAAAVSVVLAVTLSIGAYVTWDTAASPLQVQRASPEDGALDAGTGSPAGRGVPSAGVAHREARAPIVAQPSGSLAAPASFTVRGRALFADGVAAGNVGLALSSDPLREIGRTHGDGGFEITAAALPVRLVGADDGIVTLAAGACDTQGAETLLVLARAIRFSGRVLDGDQRALPNVYVRFHLAPDWMSRLGVSLESTESRTWSARSDRDGRFAFDAAPDVRGSALRAVLDGYQSRAVPAPDQARNDIEIVLTRPVALAAATLRGRVLTLDGAAGSGARVALGLTTALADDKGFFELDLGRAVTADQLRAVKEGFQPAQADRPAENGPRGGWPEYVELRLGPPALTIAGRVVDHAGTPVADARVWLGDQTPFGVIGHMPLASEGLAAGATIPPQALETAARLPDRDGDNFNDYRVTKPAANACWPFVTTDRSGHFVIRGLSARAYTLEVLDPNSLQLHTSGPHTAGAQDVRVQLDEPDVFETIRARVVCRGMPMPQVAVALRCTPFDIRTRTFGGTVEVKFEHPGAKAVTDQDGRCTFSKVPKLGCHLILRGEHIVPHEHRIASDSPADLVIEVDARYQVQVRLRPPLDRASAIAAVDADGQPLDLLVLAAGSTNAYTDLPLHDGKSQVFSLSSRAKKILLLQGGHPADAIEVQLVPGIVNVVEG